MAKQKTKEKGPKTGVARIFELAADRKGMLYLAALLSACAAIASFVPYFSVYYIIKEVISVYPNFSLLDQSLLLQYGLLALIGIGLDVLCYLLSSICAHSAAFGTQYKLKSDFTKHLAKIPLGFHLSIGSGRFRKVIDEDIEKIESFLAHSFPDIVATIVSPIVMIILLFFFDWRFGLAILVAVIIGFALQMMTFGAAGPELMEQMQKSMADMSGASVEYVRGMPVLKAFNQSATSFRQLVDSIKAYTKFMLTYTLKWETMTSLFQTIMNNIYLLLLPVGILIGSTTSDYKSFVLSFIFYLLFAPAVASILQKVMYVSSSTMRIAGGVANFDQMMNLPELKIDGNEEVKDNRISFHDVSFAYNDTDEDALTDVSFDIEPSSVCAIVGPSGSGKSTIAHLLLRFWDIQEGSIKIGGSDIRNLSEDTLMKQVSFVFQDVYLFGQSIKENIKMGCPNASDEEVMEAAKAAQCDEFIQLLPKKYDTVIGEDGVHLSGGEKQRIAIARCIIQNAPILVLDEATAFADPENEHKIQLALSKLMKGKTVVMIAHRLGTIKDANQIIVMDKGCVAQVGTHTDLVKQEGLYNRMWNNYTRSVEWRLGEEESTYEDDQTITVAG